MKLYMKQKVFSIRQGFSVLDEFQQPKYYVEGEVPVLGRRLHIFDENRTEVAVVRQKLLTLLPRFIISVRGQDVGVVKRELTLLRPVYTIESMGWTIEGAIHSHDYSIMNGFTTIATIHKKWMTFGDSFELDINDPADAPAAIAVVIAIDCCMDEQYD